MQITLLKPAPKTPHELLRLLSARLEAGMLERSGRDAQAEHHNRSNVLRRRCQSFERMVGAGAKFFLQASGRETWQGQIKKFAAAQFSHKSSKICPTTRSDSSSLGKAGQAAPGKALEAVSDI